MISIETLHNHTPEEVFTFVAKQLIAQKVPSTMRYDKSICMYRGEGEGGEILKCAAGHLIPDYLYNQNMEEKKFFMIHKTLSSNNVIGFYDTFENASEYADGLIDALQKCHDVAAHRDAYEGTAYLENLVVLLDSLADKRGYKRVELESQIV